MLGPPAVLGIAHSMSAAESKLTSACLCSQHLSRQTTSPANGISFDKEDIVSGKSSLVLVKNNAQLLRNDTVAVI